MSTGVPLFNALVPGVALNSVALAVDKQKTSLCRVVQEVFPYLEPVYATDRHL